MKVCVIPIAKEFLTMRLTYYTVLRSPQGKTVLQRNIVSPHVCVVSIELLTLW